MSDTADLNIISMPTRYVEMVQVEEDVYRLGKNGVLFAIGDPDRAVADRRGRPLTLDAVRASGATVSKSFSDVSWRTEFGADLQYPSSAGNFLDAVRQVSPDVNTIRVDFNAYTLRNDGYLKDFHAFTTAAADRGFKLIIQYSDGLMAGRVRAGGRQKAPDPSARMEEIGTGWQEVMAWFEDPAQAPILNAVYGFEIINEPMAYPKTAEGGRAYARDIRHIVDDLGIDWHGRKILVGGLGASGTFRNVDLDTIRRAVGDQLVWSLHGYPGWLNPSEASFDRKAFLSGMADRLGDVGDDDVLLTETHLGRSDQDANGIPDLLDPHATGTSAASFNAARTAEWFAESGIGWTYWPMAGRRSSPLLNAGKGAFDVSLPQLAFANNVWSFDEAGTAEEAGDDTLTARRVEGRIKTAIAQAYGRAGDDTITADPGVVNLLYGGDGQDDLTAGPEGDWLFGQRGDDRVTGGTGADRLFGGPGDDTVTGGAGDDWIEGGDGRDRLEGGAGNDTILAGEGSNVVSGEGNDLILLTKADEDGRPLIIDELQPGDRIDLSAWVPAKGSKRKGTVELTAEPVAIAGEAPGLLLYDPGKNLGIVLTARALDGFRGVENFSGADSGLSLRNGVDEGRVLDPATGQLVHGGK
ncbi:cellulase family glycosylhydrolase [Falsirhodobacter sp. 20TX0035]|uniref:cellulase family glycosylhydrolase n=1 Tax=Falsirhodobacter sp. 20TX0035 TaxID=3022019 RepID=UPI00232D1373|nr:cellulase family glycosylhydrolase [Falsirhodobacter sp. 20TX0035]MDB6452988.1 cellulase family glycosylhydrolase [Falsirhodobacter sp. 20TX0035]